MMIEVYYTNFKLSFKGKLNKFDTIVKNSNSFNAVTAYNNFIVCRDEFSYTIFKKNIDNYHHINVTKINHPSQIFEIYDYLITFFELDGVNELKIDNICLLVNIYKKINCERIFKEFHHLYNMNFIIQRFPGLFLYTENFTLVFFASGKINILGVKNILDIQYALSIIVEICV